jgi:hypothetical protein
MLLIKKRAVQRYLNELGLFQQFKEKPLGTSNLTD